MGRFVSGAGGNVPRKQSVRLTASNPSVAIPSWARVAYITGTGPGGGGGNSNGTSVRGGGGGAGGYCARVPLQITNETSIAVVIAAPGTGAAGSSSGAGTAGGNTTVTMGAQVLTLEGGQAGGGNASSSGGTGGLGGRALAAAMPALGDMVTAPFGAGTNNGSIGLGYGSPSPLSSGARGGNGAQAPEGFGAGGYSAFGPGGSFLASVSANTPGTAPAAGFGGGGSGSCGTAVGGAGGPSFVLIEFEEAL